MLLLHPITSSSDISSINHDLDTISSWLSSKSLFINLKKTKYMFFSLRPQTYFNSLPPIVISDTIIDRVFSFKYLGLIFTPNLSWSSHIQSTKKKAQKIIGLIYRQFYTHCSSSTLLTLYKLLVRPILEYAAVIWDPVFHTNSNSLESVQHFALKIVSKSWFSDYSSLLSIYNLPTLNQRRKRAKMIQLYKEKFNLSHILESPLKSVSASPAHFTRSFSRHNFQPIHCM